MNSLINLLGWTVFVGLSGVGLWFLLGAAALLLAWVAIKLSGHTPYGWEEVPKREVVSHGVLYGLFTLVYVFYYFGMAVYFSRRADELRKNPPSFPSQPAQ